MWYIKMERLLQEREVDWTSQCPPAEPELMGQNVEKRVVIEVKKIVHSQ